MMDTQQSQDAASYTTRLDKTLRALQKRVREQEALLQELRNSSAAHSTEPSEDNSERLLQLRALKAAYDAVTPAEPWLPSPDSPLPALLALRNTDRCIRESQECITSNEKSLKTVLQRAEKESADLGDSKLIQDALNQRSKALREKIDEQTQKSPARIAKDMIRDVRQKKDHFDNETNDLIASFNKFIDDHLAVMLAAEQLGGPVAGQDADVGEESLEAGFNTQGKPKQSKTKINEDKRQQRIDKIWGAKPVDENDRDEAWDEKTAAAAEMRELTEQLLNHLVEANGKGPGTYVQLQRDSAAARFLVRAKVAQFHPNNGTRLRLFDFGGELED